MREFSLPRFALILVILATLVGCDANDAEPGAGDGGSSGGGTNGGGSGSGGGSSGGGGDDSGQADVPPASNAPPTIAGAPAMLAETGLRYIFTPTASDADGDTLNFTISNPPPWGTFDTETGELVGIPADTDSGDYPDIVITVSDGEGSVANR